MSACAPARGLDDRFRRLLHEATGIRLTADRASLVELRLRPRLAALGLPDLDAYFRLLFERGGLEAELPRIVELMTTNKTDFFREPAHFDLLADRLVPAAMAGPRSGGRGLFKVWSAAASTGAEAWSAAMQLAAAEARHPGLRWAVLGTDISRRVLAVAERAVYPETEFLTVPPELLGRYTMGGRTGAGTPVRRIVPELRSRVRFGELNLVKPPYPVDRDIDVIFLRNVLIYFDGPTQEKVIAEMAGHLRPGGHLLVGHSESMLVRRAGLRQIGPGAYHKTETGGA